MTVGLLTITHDEEMLLPSMLASVQHLVDGPTFAFHIGSRDDTPEILADFGAEVHVREWTDDRLWNDLFALARGRADRFLTMGANSVIEGDLPALADEVPCYMVRHRRGPYEYRLPNLIRGDIEWTVNRPVHATLEPTFIAERQPLDDLVVQISDADGRRPEKIARYLPICEKMVEENPDDARAVFYLARTYFDVGRFPEAIGMYARRVAMGGWDEEVWHAHYMMGVAQIRLAQFEEGRSTLMAAYHRRPSRAEPLNAICKSMLPPDDLLFIESEVYGSL